MLSVPAQAASSVSMIAGNLSLWTGGPQTNLSLPTNISLDRHDVLGSPSGIEMLADTFRAVSADQLLALQSFDLIDDLGSNTAMLAESDLIAVYNVSAGTPYSVRVSREGSWVGGLSTAVKFQIGDVTQFAMFGNGSRYADGVIGTNTFMLVSVPLQIAEYASPNPLQRHASMDIELLFGQGANQTNPIVPAPSGDVMEFQAARSGRWFDPATDGNYTFSMLDGALFTRIVDFPQGAAGPVTVSANGQSLGSFSPGQSVDFVSLLGTGVESFTVTGITSPVNAGPLPAGSIQLAFDRPLAEFSITALPSFVLGDMDGSGALDAFDVDDFELALANPQAYMELFPSLNPVQLGDINGDGALDAFDVSPFEVLLAGGLTGGAGMVVPEPGSMALFAMAAFAALKRRNPHSLP